MLAQPIISSMKTHCADFPTVHTYDFSKPCNFKPMIYNRLIAIKIFKYYNH